MSTYPLTMISRDLVVTGCNLSTDICATLTLTRIDKPSDELSGGSFDMYFSVLVHMPSLGANLAKTWLTLWHKPGLLSRIGVQCNSARGKETPNSTG